MSIWSNLRGHAVQREMFSRAMQRGRLSQSYLLVGPDGIGKQLFARKMAQCLLCRAPGGAELEACGECSGCRPFLAGNHPDFLYVTRPEGKRELQIDLIAGPKERRGQEGLCHDLSLHPLEGSRKVAIINDADAMNEESANAFLKTLEEPPERAILLLIAANLDAVMPTIRSRCQLVRFSPLSNDDVESLLIEQGLVPSAAEAKFASTLSEGSLTIARQLLQPELREMRTTLYSTLSQKSFSGLTLARTLMEGIDKMSADTPEQRVNANWLIRFAVEYYRSALRILSQSDRSSSGADSNVAEVRGWAAAVATRGDAMELIGSLIERAIDASSHIEQNVPVPLCLESLLDDLSRMTREPLMNADKR
ncbi:MAG: DNA polymerase III subunit delta' [Planctomycetota bacterium]